MRRKPARFFTLALVASLALAALAPVVALADDGRTAVKRAYVQGARHSPILIGGEEGNPFLAGDPAAPDGSLLTRGSAPSSPDDVEDLRNVQVNDPALDHIQTFAGTRPFEFSIQSETSIVQSGRNIVVGYNSSANQPVVQTSSGALVFVRRFFSGFSSSRDGGKTWTSGFVPPNPGSIFTFGDPSLGIDRAGNFYYAHLGASATPSGLPFTVIVNKSTDGGATFAPAVVAALDDGSDKEWLAVGPDPTNKKQDNVYVAWTSFQDPTAANPGGSSQLRFVRSTDGGATWSAQRILFAPNDASGGTNPAVMSSFIQFANPTVDASNGRLYIPFLHFSNTDADFVKVLVSDDGGVTFRFLKFNVPGALDPFGFPNVTPGELSDCGRQSGGIRLVLHQGANLGGGRFGLARYRQATRLISQPGAVAAEGRLFVALNTSTSPFFGDPTSGSSIRLLYSLDGGTSFATASVAPSTSADPQHVHPSVSTDENGELVRVAYYVQQANGKLRVDASTGELQGRRVRFGGSQHVSSVASDLPPSNNPFPLATNPFFTTNYDRTVRPCYAIGEYLSITSGGDNAIVAWGDMRNSWTSPVGSPAAGTHSQPDVFFEKLQQ